VQHAETWQGGRRIRRLPPRADTEVTAIGPTMMWQGMGHSPLHGCRLDKRHGRDHRFLCCLMYYIRGPLGVMGPDEANHGLA
jgi:hypothetical protein